MVKLIINYVLVSLTGIIALVKLLQAVLNDNQKEIYESKIKNLVDTLKDFKPYELIESIGKDYIIGLLIEILSYIIIILLLIRFVDFIDLINAINFEVAIETFGKQSLINFLMNTNKIIDFISSNLWITGGFAFILTIIRRYFRQGEEEPLFSDIKDYFEDGSYAKFLSVLVFNFIKIGMIFGFYYFLFNYLHGHIFRDTLLDNILFYGSILLILAIPILSINLFYYFSVAIFLFLVLTIINVIILIFSMLLSLIDWIFNNPKKNWAILTALIGVISYIFKFWK